jgi:glycerol uptake facilitator protein
VLKHPALPRQCLAEFLGTFLLVFFGTGSVFVAVLTGALQGLFQVAIVWGLVVAMSIYTFSAISGSHINPAVTIACAVWRKFPPAKIAPYLLSQLAGAFVASVVLYGLFSGILSAYESDNHIVRGQDGSERSAMVFGEYFPNPGTFGATPRAHDKLSPLQAMAAEALGTGLLVFFVFALTDRRNRNRPDGTLFALCIGLSLTMLLCVIAPLTQAGFNPARDFGPRLLAWLLGWGRIAIPGPRGGFFTVYILSPIIGGLVGGAVYDLLVRPGHTRANATA